MTTHLHKDDESKRYIAERKTNYLAFVPLINNYALTLIACYYNKSIINLQAVNLLLGNSNFKYLFSHVLVRF